MPPFPFVDLAIAGISALGDFLLGSSQDQGTVRTGRPSVAFAAQDQTRRAIASELARARAARGQPIALPTISLPANYGEIAQIPGLDISLGLDPGLIGLGTQDFFGDINEQRAAFNEQHPGGGRRAVPRSSGVIAGAGYARDARPDSGMMEGRAADALSGPSLRQQQAEQLSHGTGVGNMTFDDPQGTLDMIGEAVAALLARTDVSRPGPPRV